MRCSLHTSKTNSYEYDYKNIFTEYHTLLYRIKLDGPNAKQQKVQGNCL